MEVTNVSIMRRRNLGNYEHEEIMLQANVDSGESYEKVIADLKVAVNNALNGLKQEEPKSDDKPVKKAKATKKTTKKKPVVESNDGAEEKPAKEAKKEVPEATTEVSLAEVKQALAQVWRDKGKSVAVEILGEFKVSRSDELNADQYADVIAECNKCLK